MSHQVDRIEELLEDLVEAYNEQTQWLVNQFNSIHRQLRSNQMATQEEIDALTTQITSLDSAANDGFTAISTELSNLESQVNNAGASVDLTALRAAVDKAQNDVTSGISSVTGQVPAPATDQADAKPADQAEPAATPDATPPQQ